LVESKIVRSRHVTSAVFSERLVHLFLSEIEVADGHGSIGGIWRLFAQFVEQDIGISLAVLAHQYRRPIDIKRDPVGIPCNTILQHLLRLRDSIL
jgi:hypothetical protein